MGTQIPYASETWEVVTGCSPDEYNTACRERCWARRLAERLPLTHGGTRVIDCRKSTDTPMERDCEECYPCGRTCSDEPVPFSELVLHPDRLSQPLKWRKPRVVFVVSRGDLFHDAVPWEFYPRVFEVMAACPQHTFLLLTKRPKKMAAVLRGLAKWVPSWDRANLWPGISAWDQDSYTESVVTLAEAPAAHRWVSLEPLLGEVRYLIGAGEKNGPDWVVTGCESGPGRRPAQEGWFVGLQEQCKAAGVPYYLKQSQADDGKVHHWLPFEENIPPKIWRTLKGDSDADGCTKSG